MYQRFIHDERITFPISYFTPAIANQIVTKLHIPEGGMVHLEIGYRCGRRNLWDPVKNEMTECNEITLPVTGWDTSTTTTHQVVTGASSSSTPK